MIFRGRLPNLIFDALRACPHGLTCRELVSIIYADEPDGGPDWSKACVHNTIFQMRRKLRHLYPLLHIVNGTGYGRRYHLVIRKT